MHSRDGLFRYFRDAKSYKISHSLKNKCEQNKPRSEAINFEWSKK